MNRKNTVRDIVILCCLALIGVEAAAQPTPGSAPNPVTDIYGHMGIGTVTPDISAMLDITSRQGGLLIPRMTVADRNTIYRPATTLVIYNMTAQQFEYNAGTPLVPNWVPFLTGLSINNYGWALAGNSGTNPTLNFLGTSDAQPIVFRTSNAERMRLSQNGNLGVGTSTPNPSAVVDINSTSQGVLIPRMTTGERDLITLPATSLLIYNSTAARFEYNAGTPAVPNWIGLGGTVSFDNVTSGTNTGQTLNVGGGTTLSPTGTGLIIANQLTGSGPNKYSGSQAIPVNANTVFVNYTGITATSNVVVTVSDPSGQTINATVTSITPGSGFLVTFAGFYPTATGSINYVVVN